MFRMKMHYIDTDNEKSFQIFTFPKIFGIFSTDFVKWNIEKGQQETNMLSRLHRKKINAVFQTKTVQN